MPLRTIWVPAASGADVLMTILCCTVPVDADVTGWAALPDAPGGFIGEEGCVCGILDTGAGGAADGWASVVATRTRE